MRNRFLLAVFLCLCSGWSTAAPRGHLISFGPWLKVRLFVGPEADRVQEIRVRRLNVDGRLREFTIGAPHDVTDRVFVVRRTFRMNDALTARPEWKWQRDGWMMVDRGTGRVSRINLPPSRWPCHCATAFTSTPSSIARTTNMRRNER